MDHLKCPHVRLKPDVVDQTLGVTCMDCSTLLAWCWAENHLPENLWNRACENDPDAKPCAHDRKYVCAICEENINA